MTMIPIHQKGMSTRAWMTSRRKSAANCPSPMTRPGVQMNIGRSLRSSDAV